MLKHRGSSGPASTSLDLGAGVIRLTGKCNQLGRIVAADGALLRGVEHVNRFILFFPAQAAFFPVVARVHLPVAQPVGVAAYAVALAAYMVGFALVEVKAVVIFTNALPALVADRAVIIVLVAVAATKIVAVLICALGAFVAHAAGFAERFELGAGAAFGAMRGFVGAIFAIAAAFAQVCAAIAAFTGGTQLVRVEMLMAIGTMIFRIAHNAQTAGVTIHCAVGA